MGFFDKLRASFARFMSGRYGIDQLGHEMVMAALVMTVIGAVVMFSCLIPDYFYNKCPHCQRRLGRNAGGNKRFNTNKLKLGF